MNKMTYNYFLLLSMAIIWGGQFALTDIALYAMDPMLIAFGRTVVGFITLFVYVSICLSKENEGKIHNTRSLFVLYLLIALTEIVVPSFLIAWGCKRIDSGIAAVLMGLVPIFTMVITWFLHKNKLHHKLIFGVMIGFIGVVILVLPDEAGRNTANTVTGVLALTGAAVNFAIGVILIKFLPHSVSPVKHMRNILGCAIIVLVLPYIFFAPPLIHNSDLLESIIALILVGVSATGLAYVMYVALVQRTSSLFTSFVNYLIPIVGVVIGNVFMHERITWNELLALLCVLSALYFITPHAKN